jgi:hypothetical protein
MADFRYITVNTMHNSNGDDDDDDKERVVSVTEHLVDVSHNRCLLSE